MAEIKRCRTPFALEQDGMTRVVAAGDLVSTDDPAFRAGSEHFEDIDVHVDIQAGHRAKAAGRGEVEQATAAPGEKRTRTRAKKGDEE